MGIHAHPAGQSPLPLRRYEDEEVVRSSLDPVSDMRTFLTYLTARDYTTGILSTRHAVAQSEVNRRAKSVAHHMGVALAYVDQAMSGPEDVSFLPAYYAILNMLKVYVLMGPHWDKLAEQRFHGASYTGMGKRPHTIMTDEITLKPKGTLPLSYETITGEHWPVTYGPLSMGDIYPYVRDCGAEYKLATGKNGGLRELSLYAHPTSKGTLLEAYATKDTTTTYLRLLRPGWRRNVHPDCIAYTRTDSPPGLLGAPAARRCLRTELIYHPQDAYDQGDEQTGRIVTPLCNKRLLLPEELPIALLFFHMSCLVRYNPDLLYGLRDSKFWPMLLAARRHALLKMMILCWSFAHQHTLILRHG